MSRRNYLDNISPQVGCYWLVKFANLWKLLQEGSKSNLTAIASEKTVRIPVA